MRCEIPDCRRCCFCVPLRSGILIFGYLNLIFNILVLVLETWLDFGSSATSNTMTLYRGVGMYTQLWLPYLLYLLEIIFHVVLIVGAHMKRTRLIRIYYYYGILTAVAACLVSLVVRYENQFGTYYFDFLESALVFSGFVLQVYLLLLIRTELQKLKYSQGQFTYINHMTEVALDPPMCDNGRNIL